jgi:hypothetical protein
MQSHKLTAEDALAFILAGNSTFTILKPSTGGRFTYHVSIPKDKTPETSNIWFVSVLTGSDNEHNYSYIGYIKIVNQRHTFIHGGSKAKANLEAASVVVFNGVFNTMLTHGMLSSKLEVWHEGKCGRCGRKLTVPESIKNGIGPECARIQSKYQQSLRQLNLY